MYAFMNEIKRKRKKKWIKKRKGKNNKWIKGKEEKEGKEK